MVRFGRRDISEFPHLHNLFFLMGKNVGRGFTPLLHHPYPTVPAFPRIRPCPHYPVSDRARITRIRPRQHYLSWVGIWDYLVGVGGVGLVGWGSLTDPASPSTPPGPKNFQIPTPARKGEGAGSVLRQAGSQGVAARDLAYRLYTIL